MRPIPTILFLPVVAACDGRDALPASLTLALRATPESFAPGETVLLQPLFRDGTARIDPDVGTVESGGSYRVGPVSADRTYTLTVLRTGGRTETQVLTVPLRYRERVRELAPSPIARTRHGAALLADGRVLLVGGSSPGPLSWANTETCTAAGAFAPAGELSATRSGSQVVPLPDGSALAFGGPVNQNSFELATRVEQWDPGTLAWSVRGNLVCSRQQHSATLLLDGKVLVAGGLATGGLPTDRDAELWVPGFGSRQPAVGMLRRRAGHSATLLPDGRVLLAGGYDPGSGDAVREAEIFDPDLDAFVATGGLVEGRWHHAAVTLRDGRVLLVGGEVLGQWRASAELYDPATGLFTAAGAMATARSDVRAVRLGDGSVLVAGGSLPGNAASDAIELWSPATGAFRPWGARLPAPRTGHSLSLLPDARVLLLGGDPGSGFPVPTAWVLD